MIVFRPYKYLWSERSNYGMKPEKPNNFNAKLFFFFFSTVEIKLHYNPSLKEAGKDNLLMETI